MNKIFPLAETVENYFDDNVLETTDSIFEEILKAFPITSSGIAIYQVFRSYNEKQKLQNILEFIKEGENLEPGSLLKIFKDQNNLEIGSELLNALDKTYLVHQSKMLARVALLYDIGEINRLKFLRYAHIIPKFTSFLLEQLKVIYKLHIVRKDLNDYRIHSHDFDGAGLELINLGFLVATSTLGGGDIYKGNDELVYFFENIYQNKYGKN